MYAPRLNNAGQNREKNHSRDYPVNLLLDVRDFLAEREADHHHTTHPEDTAENVVREVSRIAHPRGPSHGRAERPDYGNEPREDNCLAAVLVVKRLRAFQMLLLEEPRIFSPVEVHAGLAPDEIPELVAGNRAERNGQEQPC